MKVAMLRQSFLKYSNDISGGLGSTLNLIYWHEYNLNKDWVFLLKKIGQK